jgi:hypothetical protein
MMKVATLLTCSSDVVYILPLDGIDEGGTPGRLRKGREEAVLRDDKVSPSRVYHNPRITYNNPNDPDNVD